MTSRTLPNVIVIGASKCATTALYYYLSNHPEVFVPKKKELHFHSSKDLINCTGGPGDRYIIKEICKETDQYESFFENAEYFKARVDVSPSYLFFTSSIKSIQLHCGNDVKIICLVKHPVDKMISQYSHLVSDGLETLSFEQALNEECKRREMKYSDMWLYKESAFMADKIILYKSQFKNLLVLNSSDLITNLEETLCRLFRFIHVDPTIYSNYSQLTKNSSGLPKSRIISTIFIKPTLFTFALRRIIPQKLGRRVREWINEKNKGEKYVCDEKTYRSLEFELHGEIEKLNSLIDSESLISFRFSKSN